MENNNIRNSPKVSVVVPTYNVEPYLLKCLKSIAEQTYNNIECIIIIDGATDNSFDIAKNFCKHDDRFSVYWQENAGSGPARNNGIKHANGSFIIFIDPDDWVKKDYIERLLYAQNEGDFDLVTSASDDYYFSKDNILTYIKKMNVQDEIIRGVKQVRNRYAFLLNKSLICSPTKILYKKDIIDKNNIEFPDLRRSQDIVFNYRYYNYISSVRVLNFHGYCYRIEFSQRLNRLKPDYYKTIKTQFAETKQLHIKWNEYKNINLIANIYLNSLSAAIESCVATNKPISQILNDKELQQMINLSSVHSISQICFKILFRLKMLKLMRLMMKIKHKIKQKKFE